jgi:hypothetical protein
MKVRAFGDATPRGQLVVLTQHHRSAPKAAPTDTVDASSGVPHKPGSGPA